MDRSEDSHFAKTTRTLQYVHSPNPPHQLGPGKTSEDWNRNHPTIHLLLPAATLMSSDL
jgi:hypothetical protein